LILKSNRKKLEAKKWQTDLLAEVNKAVLTITKIADRQTKIFSLLLETLAPNIMSIANSKAGRKQYKKSRETLIAYLQRIKMETFIKQDDYTVYTQPKNTKNTEALQLSFLSECVLIVNTQIVEEAYNNVLKVREELDLEKYRIRNLADAKKLEKEGNYNPAADLMRLYGWNPGPTMTNLYIKNDTEATFYAKVLFNKYLGQTRTINTNIIQRPELCLNRPYYFERTDAIGLLDEFSLKFAIDSESTSDIRLSYIRQNVLSYDYSLGNLDNIADGEHNNEFFAAEAEEYYEDLFSLQTDTLSQKAVNRLTTGYGKGTTRVVTSYLGENVRNNLQKARQNAFPNTYVYSAHDYLGHIDYDKTINQFSPLSEEKSTGQFETIFKGLPDTSFNYKEIQVVCTNIYNTFQLLKDARAILNSSEDDIKQKKQDLSKIDDTLIKQKSQLSTLEKNSKSNATAIGKLRREINVNEALKTRLNNQISFYNTDKVSRQYTISNLIQGLYGMVATSYNKEKPYLIEPTDEQLQGYDITAFGGGCLYYSLLNAFNSDIQKDIKLLKTPKYYFDSSQNKFMLGDGSNPKVDTSWRLYIEVVPVPKKEETKVVKQRAVNSKSRKGSQKNRKTVAQRKNTKNPG
jgi:hypothetical protein